MSRRSQIGAQVARFDAVVDRGFDHLRGRRVPDKVFYVASDLGDFSLVWMILGALRGLRSERDWHAAVRLGAAAGVESFLVNWVVKSFFRRTRPIVETARPHRLRVPLTSSFPSGHATSAFSAALLLSDDDVLWPFYYATAVVVASSRVHVRIHHASDVVVGAALGTAFGLVARRLYPLPPATGVLPPAT
ncbi:MAG TPA: phosphatase PAP2 family protein [Acidimicrobiales bacterium]|nr:phosphatase PAP2 family protein [Acidimicrobiales bacterium]